MFRQLIRFGIIGATAALANFLVVILLVETLAMHPLIANIFAFLIAFSVSYFGHRHWTFKATHTAHKSAMLKFFIVAAVSFALNEGLFYIFLIIFHLYYILALFIVLMIVPLFTFVSSKTWAFR